VSDDYEVRGDSLRITSPERKLSSLRTWGDGWVGLEPDSAGGQRDWIAGGTVAIDFAERDSAGVSTSAVRQILAASSARMLYRMAPEQATGRASINYTRADTIVVTMRVTADSNTVDRVEARGNVDGVHLSPAAPRADTLRDTARTRADSVPPARVAPDTAARAARPRATPERRP
jgi:hypothetical protein